MKAEGHAGASACSGARRVANDPEAVPDQNVAGEDEEQHRRLEDACGRLGHVHDRLRDLSADIGDGEDKAGEKDADRIEPPKERDDDRGEAVAGGKAEVDLPELAHDLENAGEARHAAADHQGRPDRARGVEAAVARRFRRRTDGPHREAVDRARHEEPEDKRQHNGDHKARRHHGSRYRVGQELRGGQRRGLREIMAVRVLPRAADQIVEHLQRDIDQHQGGEHLGDAEARLEERRDRRPGHAAQNARGDHERDDPKAFASGSAKATPAPASAPMMYWPSAPMFQILA